MTKYPYTQNGVTRWACCDSAIGPACKHKDTSGGYAAILTYHHGKEYEQTLHTGDLETIALSMGAAPLTACLYRMARHMEDNMMGGWDESVGWYRVHLFRLTD